MNLPRVIVLMGTSGSGKTTVGQALAADLGGRFVDADDFHPAENVAKMSSGVPLEDVDRWPWLDRLRSEVVEAADGSEVTVLACSALKRAYRKRLGAEAPDVALVHLAGSRELLLERMNGRGGHFMKTGLLASQCDTLEAPEPSEGIAVSIDGSVEEIVAEIRARLGMDGPAGDFPVAPDGGC